MEEIMKKRGKILALAAIVVVGAVVLSRCGHKNTAAEYESRPTVKVENPVRQDISLYTDLTGLVEPQSRASVMPKMSGEVLEVYFQAGHNPSLCDVLYQQGTRIPLERI